MYKHNIIKISSFHSSAEAFFLDTHTHTHNNNKDTRNGSIEYCIVVLSNLDYLCCDATLIIYNMVANIK